MTETLTVVEVDEQTREELQPPCEAYRHVAGFPPCVRPAIYIARFAMTCSCFPSIYLMCAEHASFLLDEGGGEWECTACQADCALVGVEALR